MKRRWFASVIAAAVVAAAVPSWSEGAGSGAFNHEAWMDAVRSRGLDPADVVYPFHATDEMREWTAERLMAYQALGPSKQLEVLQQELFDPKQFDFAYQDAVTLAAPDAFAARHGNCMAFTSMFVALARSVGIPTFLVKVRRAPEADRDETVVVVNRHVVAGYRGTNEMSLYDFYVTSATPYIQHWVIDDVQASAMFHNNLGGEAIRKGDLAAAERHLVIATRLDPDWAPAWVNLGVARFRSGDAAAAMSAYERALEIEPGNSSALTNIALVHRQEGRDEEARAALRAAAEGRANPFTLIAMADVEMGRGDFDAAEKYLRRARWWYRDEPEVYDAMARLARRRGDDRRAADYAEDAAALRRQRSGEGRADTPMS
jgi:Flp pilus assembly protein TadD